MGRACQRALPVVKFRRLRQWFPPLTTDMRVHRDVSHPPGISSADGLVAGC